MALLIKKNQYLRMLLDDEMNFEIYASQDDRLRYKNATSSNLIIDKYLELIASAKTIFLDYIKSNKIDITKIYSLVETDAVLKKLMDEFNLIYSEYCAYIEALRLNKNNLSNFEIMKQYYPDVADSIPNIVKSGYICMSDHDNLESLYNEIKTSKLFGKTSDC